MIPEERRNRILTKLTEKGVYSVNGLGDILRVVFRRAEKVNLLADSSKFFKYAMLDIAHVM